MFVGRNDGRLTALDSSTGKQLWEFQTGAGMHAPASTFEHKGKQYVLAFSAGSALIGSARGDSVWLFGLDGTLPPVQPGQSVSRTAAAATRPADVAAAAGRNGLGASAANLAEGKRLFGAGVRGLSWGGRQGRTRRAARRSPASPILPPRFRP